MERRTSVFLLVAVFLFFKSYHRLERLPYPSPQNSIRREHGHDRATFHSVPVDVSRYRNSDLLSPFDDEDVIVLGRKNFSKFITENQYVLVNFYAPWCYWSKRLAPEYGAAATMLKGKAVLAKVDATAEGELASKIYGYPTVRFYIGGVHVENYYGDRTRDAVATWVNQKLSPSIYTVATTEEAKLVLASESWKVLGFFETLKGEDVEEFAAAAKLQPDAKFYQTISADVAEIFGIDPLIKRPALVMVKKSLGEYISLGAHFHRLKIAKFVRLNKCIYPLVNSLVREASATPSSSQRPQRVRNLTKQFVKCHRLVTLSPQVLDLETTKQIFPPVDGHREGMTHVEDVKPRKMIRMAEHISNDFIISELSSSLPQSSLSREQGHDLETFDDSSSRNSILPLSYDDKDVMVLGQKNFSKFLAENQYVLVNYYASWCYFSTRLAPEYGAAATMLKGKAVLAKVDATTEAEFARESKINGYPTLRFYIGGVHVESYYGDRTRDAIATWVNNKISPGINTGETTEEAEQVITYAEDAKPRKMLRMADRHISNDIIISELTSSLPHTPSRKDFSGETLVAAI